MNETEVGPNNVNLINQGLYLDPLYRNSVYDYDYEDEDENNRFNIDN
jgi:hypothetical protein